MTREYVGPHFVHHRPVGNTSPPKTSSPHRGEFTVFASFTSVLPSMVTHGQIFNKNTPVAFSDIEIPTTPYQHHEVATSSDTIPTDVIHSTQAPLLVPQLTLSTIKPLALPTDVKHSSRQSNTFPESVQTAAKDRLQNDYVRIRNKILASMTQWKK